MTPSGVENVTIELAILKNPHFEPEILFLAIIEVKNELKWPKFTILTLEMTPSGVKNVTIELAVLKIPHFEPEISFLALLEVKNEIKWPKVTILTLKYDLLTLKMTPSGVENVTIELAVLKNPHFDPENMFLAMEYLVILFTKLANRPSLAAAEKRFPLQLYKYSMLYTIKYYTWFWRQINNAARLEWPQLSLTF